MTTVPVSFIENLELRFAPLDGWQFAVRYRDKIEAHFAACQRTNPALWNGRVLILRDLEILPPTLCGTYVETGDCFSMGALRGTDGAFLLGVMATHTANSGKIYFPCGIPDLTDITGSTVDLFGSMARELAEETGILAGEFDAQFGWYAVRAGLQIALIKVLQSSIQASELQESALQFLGTKETPELAGIRIVRNSADFDPMMPPFVTAFLTHFWDQRDYAIAPR
jgi:8-oxo-dGTP pyrophosphatase MutT (NUDIX family)